jgi:hypothetical protein
MMHVPRRGTGTRARGETERAPIAPVGGLHFTLSLVKVENEKIENEIIILLIFDHDESNCFSNTFFGLKTQKENDSRFSNFLHQYQQ